MFKCTTTTFLHSGHSRNKDRRPRSSWSHSDPKPSSNGHSACSQNEGGQSGLGEIRIPYVFTLRIALYAGIRVKSYLLLLSSDLETAANIRSQWTFIQLNKPLWTFEALKTWHKSSIHWTNHVTSHKPCKYGTGELHHHYLHKVCCMCALCSSYFVIEHSEQKIFSTKRWEAWLQSVLHVCGGIYL